MTGGDVQKAFPISIHALHEESDAIADAFGMILLTPISIHALHEESDSVPHAGINWTTDFNPRSP